jgi:hypothetical protein
MGSGQSSEREVTVEERAGEDGPQIIVTQDFLEYVHERQEEEGEGDGGGGGRRERRNRYPPPHYPEDTASDIPHLTTDDMISSALPAGRRGGGERREYSVWQRKYELEREKNSELKRVTDNEFVKTVGEIRQQFQEADVLDMLPVCEDKRNEVLQCYQRHSRKPLLCSDEVKAFSSCVETSRQKLLQAK